MIFWILEKNEKTRTRFVRLRNKERTEDALALIGDEGRDEQRNATGSSKYAEIRRCPNGGTRPPSWDDILICTPSMREARRRELKHLSTCRRRK